MSRSQKDQAGGHRCGHGYHAAHSRHEMKHLTRRRWLKQLRRCTPGAERFDGRSRHTGLWESG